MVKYVNQYKSINIYWEYNLHITSQFGILNFFQAIPWRLTVPDTWQFRGRELETCSTHVQSLSEPPCRIFLLPEKVGVS